MAGIIVVFPNRDNADHIRNLLVRGGLTVTVVYTAGAQAVNHADAFDEGIVLCGYKLKDMMYTELRECLPHDFEMLLIASQEKWSSAEEKGVSVLSMPLKAYELIHTVQMMAEDMECRRKRRKEEKVRRGRTPAHQEMIWRAKELLMKKKQMTEEEAHRYLQKCSMDSGRDMTETAEMVLSMMSGEI